MRRFNFPFAYEPKVNLKNTIIYSSIFKQKIYSYLETKYKCIILDPTLIVDNKNSALSYQSGDRVLSFDNKANNSIFLFNSTQDNYLELLSNTFKTENFVVFAPNIKRDATQSNLDSVIDWRFNVELSIPVNMNIEYFTTLAKETFYALVNLTYLTELKNICKVNAKKISVSNFYVVDAQKIESSYPTLSLKEAFNHFCSQHKFVIVQNNIKKLKSGQSIEPFVSTAHDDNISCGLYVYDETNEQPVNLINVCKRPDGETAKRQLNDSNPIEITNNLYDNRLFNKKRPCNISLSINYTNFLFYFLDKIHLSEVVKSVWPDDFIDFVNSEKIEIF